MDLRTDLDLAAGSKQTLNSGELKITGGDLSFSQNGASAFTNTGKINLEAGRQFSVSSGSVNLQPGTTVSGASATLSLLSTRATLGVDLSNADVGLDIGGGTTVGGTGKLINAQGKTLDLSNSTINSALQNQGTLSIRGSETINGALTNEAGAVLRVLGTTVNGSGNLTVANGFTNSGTIQLSSEGSSQAAVLTVTNGVLTNSTGAEIQVQAGAGGHGAMVVVGRGLAPAPGGPPRSTREGRARAAPRYRAWRRRRRDRSGTCGDIQKTVEHVSLRLGYAPGVRPAASWRL